MGSDELGGAGLQPAGQDSTNLFVMGVTQHAALKAALPAVLHHSASSSGASVTTGVIRGGLAGISIDRTVPRDQLAGRA